MAGVKDSLSYVGVGDLDDAAVFSHWLDGDGLLTPLHDVFTFVVFDDVWDTDLYANVVEWLRCPVWVKADVRLQLEVPGFVHVLTPLG